MVLNKNDKGARNMSQIDSEVVKEYLAKAGKALLDLARDTYGEAGDRAFTEGDRNRNCKYSSSTLRSEC
jgi:hypothetical protein